VNLHKTLIGVINEELMPRFRTKIEDLLPKIPAKASGEQIAAMLRNNGVSDHEIKWTKLDALLKQPKVTKDEIVDHLANHGLPFHTMEQPKQYQNWALKGGKNYGEKTFHMDPSDRNVALDWEKSRADKESGEIESWETKGGEYFTDQHYSTVWVLDENNQIRVIGRTRNHDSEASSMFKKVFVEVVKDKAEIPTAVEKAKKACQDYANKVAGEQNIDRRDYQSSHWHKGTNPLFHIRHQEFKDADGKDLWLIEEIQSDWHQQGRKQGYKGDFKGEVKHDPGTDKNVGWDWHVHINDPKLDKGGRHSSYKTKEAAEKGLPEAVKAWNNNNGVPDGPMKKTWEEMSFKWALHQAVKAGADRIGWITGNIAADRFDISKQVDDLELTNVAFDDPEGYAKRGAPPYLLHGEFRGEIVLQKRIELNQLDDVVGKEVAKRLMDQPEDEHHTRKLEGDGIKVGGEGMKAAYDQRIVSIAKKIAKITGAMVGKVALPEADGKKQHDEDDMFDPDSLDFDEDEDDEGHVTFKVRDGDTVVAGPFETENEAHEAAAKYQQEKDANRRKAAPLEVWYMDLNEKTKAMVEGGMRATFESVKPKTAKPWWVV
jgi:hypothetical protein